MVDPLREEIVTLRDGRAALVRAARLGDEEALLENINLVCKEEVFLMMDEVPWDLERERAWIASFDGQDRALFVAVHDGSIVGHADSQRGDYPKLRHTGTIGITIRDGWREAGLGRILMNRVLEWMRAAGFAKACLSVFATNVRATRLYESLGFQSEGVLSRHVRIRNSYVDEIVMGLWLGP